MMGLQLLGNIKSQGFERTYIYSDFSMQQLQACLRPEANGKFLSLGTEKLFIRGVTYGTFRSRPDGSEIYDPVVVERDFASRCP